MDVVEQVALWAGLIASIVSIVLSGVAIWFAIFVDRSARQVTAQTIKSLQKIESDVERLSGDTRELIKAGWDKMLGSVHGEIPAPIDTGAKEIAAGVAAELRAELSQMSGSRQPGEVAAAETRLDKLLKDLEKTLAAQIRTSAQERPSVAMDQARLMLEALSSEGKALALELIRRHLTRKQYRALAEGPLSGALTELRESGLLVPVTGRAKDGSEIPVYFFSPALARRIRAVASLVTAPPEHVVETVRAELKRVGYPDSE